MPLHIGPQLHALWHGLFRTSDEIETRGLHDKLASKLEAQNLGDSAARDQWISGITAQVVDELDIDPPQKQLVSLANLVENLFDFEDYLILPQIDWAQKRSVTEYWELRDHINAQLKLLEDFEHTQHLILNALISMLRPIFAAVPAMGRQAKDSGGFSIPVELAHAARDVGNLAEQMTNVLYADEVRDAELFERTRYYLDRNVVAASGGNPDNAGSFNRRPVLPSRSDCPCSGYLRQNAV